ncbi:hypothetical protein PVK06_004747 [Gossypium arboreum]|uniref:Uncharacterized protein n=1 Tax=Gossypium arboreum TaxID=29729 RepID=A0ABR0MDW8_GOSAR|nr:hypothetical protein PVK06_047476 [Gossypium arboreum]KAK5842397.1 hypothetical protein PVK06_004747 [Gossypium arboreum]
MAEVAGCMRKLKEVRRTWARRGRQRLGASFGLGRRKFGEFLEHLFIDCILKIFLQQGWLFREEEIT